MSVSLHDVQGHIYRHSRRTGAHLSAFTTYRGTFNRVHDVQGHILVTVGLYDLKGHILCIYVHPVTITIIIQEQTCKYTNDKSKPMEQSHTRILCTRRKIVHKTVESATKIASMSESHRTTFKNNTSLQFTNLLNYNNKKHDQNAIKRCRCVYCLFDRFGRTIDRNS